MKFSTHLTSTLVALLATTGALTMPVVVGAAIGMTSDVPRYKLLEDGQVSASVPSDGLNSPFWVDNDNA